MLKKVHLFISGSVQGVFYRIKAKEEAEKLNLTGWVKNIPDDKVEILAEGEEEKLKRLIKWCYNGSENAIVSEVKIEWEKYSGKFDKFEILL